MKIVLGSDGSVELTRGEHITRGQDKSRQVFVEWAEGVSPIDTGQFLADNMVVEMCITRPDGEQSGWLTAVKVDGEIKYLYILQAWDTAVSGQASLQVRWYDITQEESSRIIEVSNEAFFIVDNGKIAQPLNLSSENYNDIVLRFITPLSTQAFRKYNVNALPDTVTYEPDGAKTAPALYFNFTHEVVDLVDEEFNEQRTVREGFLFVGKCGEIQTEVFFSSVGKIYTRSFAESPAGDFKERFEEKLLNVFSKLNFQNGEGGGSIVQKDGGVTDSEGIPLKEKDPTNPTKYDSKAPGTSAVSLNVRNKANGDASIAGGYNSTANTKADVSFNTSRAGLTEEEYNALYVDKDGNFIGFDGKGLSYADYCKKNTNCAFSVNKGVAVGPNTFSAGTQDSKHRAVAPNSATFGYYNNTHYGWKKDKDGNWYFSNGSNAGIGGKYSDIGRENSFGWGEGLTIPPDKEGQKLPKAVFGKYNKHYHNNEVDPNTGLTIPEYEALAEFGNGTSNNNVSNSAVVTYDGRVKGFGTPTDYNDFVRVQELNNAVGGISSGTQLYKHRMRTEFLSMGENTDLVDGYELEFISTQSTPFTTIESALAYVANNGLESLLNIRYMKGYPEAEPFTKFNCFDFYSPYDSACFFCTVYDVDYIIITSEAMYYNVMICNYDIESEIGQTLPEFSGLFSRAVQEYAPIAL